VRRDGQRFAGQYQRHAEAPQPSVGEATS
jgi:hypothetical protein